MNETLNQIVKQLKTQGMTAIMIQKYLRDNGYNVPWITTLRIYESV